MAVIEPMMFPLILKLALFISGILPAAASEATTVTAVAADVPSSMPGFVLMIDRPALYAAPDPGAPSTSVPWTAGTRLNVLEPATGPDRPTSEALAGWCRVGADGDGPQGWLPAVYLAPPPPPIAAETLHAIGEERVDRWHGLPPDYVPADLVSVGRPFNEGIDYRLRREAAQALELMIDAAARDGIELFVVSAYRSWEKQQQIYQRKLETGGWDQDTVARPGHSEHQLGTTVDLTNGDPETLLRESFGQTRAGRWLRENAWVYGFAQSFTRHNRAQTGYAPEPWHYRFWGISRARSRHFEALGEQP